MAGDGVILEVDAAAATAADAGLETKEVTVVAVVVGGGMACCCVSCGFGLAGIVADPRAGTGG